MPKIQIIDKAKFIRRTILVILIIILVVFIQKIIWSNKQQKLESSTQTNMLEENQNDIESTDKNELQNKSVDKITVVLKKEVELDWNLLLVNTNNKMPDDYLIPLDSLDQYRSFDKRAFVYLTQMLKAIRHAGISNVWIQSAYRTPEDQQTLFEEQVQSYKSQGYSEKKAKELTEKMINKPWHSEHNLGLAVDFNYVNREFENTDAFHWLQENAQDYGFILRYAKEKEDITKVNYEPWHWRYVGAEHAKKMKKQNLCLEEYIEQVIK